MSTFEETPQNEQKGVPRAHRFEISDLKMQVPFLKRVFRKTLLRHGGVKGSTTVVELSNAFGTGKGSGFSGEDGYYQITETTGGSLGEGPLVKIKTAEGAKTLWYPAKPEDLVGAFKDTERLFFGKAVRAIPGSVDDQSFEQRFQAAEEETRRIWSKYQFVDFGCGDGRGAIIASAFGLPSTGLDIDGEMVGIARENIQAVKAAGIPLAPIEVRYGSFLDPEVLRGTVGEGPDRKPALFYSYITPMTADLLKSLKPMLREGDYIWSYKERLSENAELQNMIKVLQVEQEIPPYLEGGMNIYSIKQEQGSSE